jgi:hypothetical protein
MTYQKLPTNTFLSDEEYLRILEKGINEHLINQDEHFKRTGRNKISTLKSIRELVEIKNEVMKRLNT